MSWRKISWLAIGLWTLPLALLLGAGVGVWCVSRTYHKPADLWAAIAGVFAGATLIAAAVGIPVGLWQLIAVQRDLRRLSPDFEKKLLDHMVKGLDLDAQFRDSTLPLLDAMPLAVWVEDGARLIAENADEAEEKFFGSPLRLGVTHR